MTLLRNLGLGNLSHITRTPLQDLERLAALGDGNYREISIPKGDDENRLLLVPGRDLKRVQRALNRRLLGSLIPHPSTACVRGRGVLWSVQPHVGRPVLLKADIANFFPSVTRQRILERLRTLGMEESAAKLFADLVCVRNQLPQGAPTSTAVGDLVLYPLDARLEALCRKEGLSYTRYVDDLAMSGGERLRTRFAPLVAKIIAGEGWTTNRKGGLSHPSERRLLLGVVVNAQASVAKEYRSSLRSVLRLAANGRITLRPPELRALESKIGWIEHVRPGQAPEFLKLLERVRVQTRQVA